jgi:hypothetical protein
MKRSEDWMIQWLSKMRTRSSQAPSGDGAFTVESLQSRLEHLRRVRERCYSYNGRCLRFWQFKAKAEGRPILTRDGAPRLTDDVDEERLLEVSYNEGET